jgi:phosphonate transport system ATP-binding protein
VLQSLRQVARERQVGVLCSLHQVDLASQYADRIIGLAHGRIVCDIPAGEIDEEIISRIYGSSITRAKPVDANRPASDSVCLPLTETLV